MIDQHFIIQWQMRIALSIIDIANSLLIQKPNLTIWLDRNLDAKKGVMAKKKKKTSKMAQSEDLFVDTRTKHAFDGTL